MSATTDVIIAQTKMMELDLVITIQKMRIRELNARSEMLRARSKFEQFKLEEMIQKFKGLEDGKA